MEKSAYQPYFVIIGLLILTSLALATTVDVNVSDTAGIELRLPDRIGDWRGDEIRYCQNRACQRMWYASELTNRDVCPVCGGRLGGMSYAERQMLPPDTVILKKRYTDPLGNALIVSIVLSGKERASIHRPQVCLVGQGREIVRSRVIEVPFDNRPPLKVMLLDLLIHPRRLGGPKAVRGEYYAYWFVGKGRETPYHLERMFWMAWDRIFHNVAHRWAYIAVAGPRDLSSDRHVEQVREFIQQMYPYLTKT